MGTDRKAFHLRWNNHMENMRSLFETSYCDQALVDVTVSCPDGKLKAHKLVLSACSPYFESVFKENPCKHPVLIMKGISYKEMSCLLEYMYKGEVDVLEADLQSLISTASDLQIRGLGYGYQTETTVAAAKATPNPLRNSPKGVKTGDMAPVATPKSQSQIVAKVPEAAAVALNQDYDIMNSSMDSESARLPRQRPQKRVVNRPAFDPVKVKKESDGFFGARPLVTPSLPKAPNSNAALPAGVCSQPPQPAIPPTSLLPTLNSASSCASPIGLTVPSVSMLGGVITARSLSPPLANKFGNASNGHASTEATNLSVSRSHDDEPTDLTSASNGFGNSEDERREGDDEDQDDDDENELHIDTSKMELSIKEEMEEDDDTIGYLCESTFTEGETTNGLSEKTEGKEGTEENAYEKEGTVCPFCFRDCKTVDALKRHVRIHTSQKPHQCEYCQLAFARSSHLERHRRTHTGERPFVCPIASCSKRFARQDKVKQHVIRHHTGLPRPVRQTSPKTYKPRAAPLPVQPGGKRPRGRPRKHPSPEDFLGHLYHGHTLLDDGSPSSLAGQTAAVSLALVDGNVGVAVSDPLTCPPAKDFANLPARNSPADFLQRDADTPTCAPSEGLSTLELSVSTQEHIQGLKQISVEPVTNPPDSMADTASVGT